MYKRMRKRLSTLLLFVILGFALLGCQRSGPTVQPAAPDPANLSATVALIDDSGQDTTGIATVESTADAAIEATSQLSIAATEAATEAPPAIAEDGTYNSRDDVALYIHTYGRLPSNFITKKEAKKLGWTGGNVEDYAPGKSIGGDYFGNYEGLLPEDKSYHECDIDTLGKSSRGARRIIYSDDGYIYYTEDHYESFELLYEP